MAIALGSSLTLVWRGQPVGRIQITAIRFRPATKYYPTAAWLVDGTFTPDAAFDACRAVFEERILCEQEYDGIEDAGDELAAAFDAMERAAKNVIESATIPEVGGKLFECRLDGDGAVTVSFPPNGGSETLPTPSHLVGWIADGVFEGELLTAAVRCPCGCGRLEFHHVGATHLGDGRPVPCSTKIRGEWFFIIRAVCTACGEGRVLFDSHLHGCNGFLNPKSDRAKLPRPRLWAWRCLGCGSSIHTGRVSVVEDYHERYMKSADAARFGPDRWPDAFGCFSMGIRCDGCGLESPGWVSYEAR